MKVDFRISSAGIAGDPHKLLVANCEFGDFYEIFNSNRLRSLRRAKKRLMKIIELFTGKKPIEL